MQNLVIYTTDWKKIISETKERIEKEEALNSNSFSKVDEEDPVVRTAIN